MIRRALRWAAIATTLAACRMPAQSIAVPRFAVSAELGHGSQTSRVGQMYFDHKSAVGRVAATARVGRLGPVFPVVRIEKNAYGKDLTDICRPAPNGSCRERFPHDAAWGAALGVAYPLTNRLAITGLAGQEYSLESNATRQFVDGQLSFAASRSVSITASARHLWWNDAEYGPLWYRPISLGLRVQWPELPRLSVSSPRTPPRGQRFGMTYGWTQSDVVAGTSSKANRHGTSFGLTYERPFLQGADLAVEILGVRRGWASHVRPALNLTYLEAPVLLRARSRTTPVIPFGLTAAAGLAPSVATDCQYDDVGCGGVSKWDVAAVAGLGLELHLPAGFRLGLEGRYARGMVRLVDRGERVGHNRTTYSLLQLSHAR
jgi:hypothetical protein